MQKGQRLDAQVLATALAVYATNVTLDSSQAAAQEQLSNVVDDGLLRRR